MQIKCPRCNEWLNSKNALALHMLGQERCYQEGTDIADKLRNDITKLRGAVEYILYREPGTRGGDDKQLLDWYRVFFLHTKFYDPKTQSFHWKGDGTVKVSEDRFEVKEDTLARRRREIQHDDEALYHHPLVPHECLLGGGQAQIRRVVQEQEHRLYYSTT